MGKKVCAVAFSYFEAGDTLPRQEKVNVHAGDSGDGIVEEGRSRSNGRQDRIQESAAQTRQTLTGTLERAIPSN